MAETAPPSTQQPSVPVTETPTVADPAPAPATTTAPVAEPTTAPAPTTSAPASPVAAPAPTEPATSPSQELNSGKKKKSLMQKLFKTGKAEETFVVHLSHPDGAPLGMKIRSDETVDGVVISEVHPDGLAAKSHKIAVGQYLHQINGKRVADLSHDDVVQCLRAPELDLLISIFPDKTTNGAAAVAAAVVATVTGAGAGSSSTDPAPTTAAATTTTDEVADAAANAPRRVVLHRNEGEAFGLSFHGDKGVTISDISKSGTAAKEENINKGDKVLFVNDTDVSEASTADVVNAIKASGNTVTLTVQPKEHKKKHTSKLGSFFGLIKKSSSTAEVTHTAPAEESAADPNASGAGAGATGADAAATTNNESLVRVVTVTRGPRGLGMKIKSEDDSDFVYVAEVIPGGAVDESGQIKAGDNIVDINGVSMHHAHQEDVVKALKAEQVVLKVVAAEDIKSYLAPPAATTAAATTTAAAAPKRNRFSFLSSLKKKSEDNVQKNVAATTAAAETIVEEKTAAAAAAATAATTSASAAVASTTATASAAVAAAVASAPSAAASDVRRVTLTRGSEGLGMKIKSDEPKNGIIVHELTPGGVAASSNMIHVGDVIFEVNGKNVLNMTHEDVVQEFKAHDSVTLSLTNTFPQQPVQKRVVALSSATPLGLTLADVASGGVTVYAVNSDSPAAGQINAGDYVLAVNGTPTLTSSASDVGSLIKENPQVELTVSDTFPTDEYAAQYRQEDIKVQALESMTRTIHQKEADAAMDLEQAQRITQEKMHDVQDSLVRQHSRVEVAKAEAEEQARRVAETSIPPADILEKKTIVQEQLQTQADAATTKALEEEEQARRITEDKMHVVQDQLVSAIDRRNAATAELDEQQRRIAEAQVVPSAAAELKHAVEAELKTVVHADTTSTNSGANAGAGVATGAVAAAVVAAAVTGSEGSEAPAVRTVVIKKGSGPLGLKIAGSRGVRITEITAGSAAAQAGGLAVGDLIVGVNDQTFDKTSSYELVHAALRSAGSDVAISVTSPDPSANVERRKSLLGSLFGQKSKEKDVAAAPSPKAEEGAKATAAAAAGAGAGAGANGPRTVVLKREGNAGLGMQLKMDPKHVGEISDVNPESPAGKAGVLPGEKIVEINGVSTVGQSLDFVINALKAGDEVSLSLANPPRKTGFRQSMKTLFSGKGSQNGVHSDSGSPASGSPAAPRSVAIAETPAETPASTSTAATAPATGATATATPAAVVVAAPESELHNENVQLRSRLAKMEMDHSAAEKRIQQLSTDLNNALQEVARLSATPATASQ